MIRRVLNFIAPHPFGFRDRIARRVARIYNTIVNPLLERDRISEPEASNYSGGVSDVGLARRAVTSEISL